MKKRLLVYSLAHFAVDFSCALLLLGRLVPAAADTVSCLLLYNFCAFALQMPLGLLCDRIDRNQGAAALGCGLVALGWALPGIAAAICAGVGNALFHVGGGLDTLNTSGERCAALGIFVSPGALGIFLGTLLAARGGVGSLVAVSGVGIALILILTCCAGPGNAPLELKLQGSPGTILALFLVVVLRSYIGLAGQFSWKAGHALALTCALVLGKALGGILADRFGTRWVAALSLGGAALLFLLSDAPAAGILGVLLFNMTMPLTLWGAAQRLPGAKGFAFGLLTFALFLGFLPAALGWRIPLAGKELYTAGALLSLPLLLWGLRGVKKC